MIVTLIVNVSFAAIASFIRILESKNPVFAPADQSTKTPHSVTVRPETSEVLKNLSKYATLSTLKRFVKDPRTVSFTSCVSLLAGVVDPFQSAI